MSGILFLKAFLNFHPKCAAIRLPKLSCSFYRFDSLIIFKDILSDAAKPAGLTLGKIDQSPNTGLLEYPQMILFQEPYLSLERVLFR